METESLSTPEDDLKRFPSAILTQFQKATLIAREHLSPSQFQQWASEGIAIAQSSPRAWEAALEYFKATPKVLEKLSFPDLISWARGGRELYEQSAALSSAYFRASPGALDVLPPTQIGDWAKMGEMLYDKAWRSTSLCCKFFETSPKLLRHLKPEEVKQLVLLLVSVAENSTEYASECLALAEEVFPRIEKQERGPFLDLALVFAQTSQRDAKSVLASGPRLLSRIERGQRRRFLSNAAVIAISDGSLARSFLFNGSQALGKLDEVLHSRLLDLFEELLSIRPAAAIDFLKNCPVLVDRLGTSDIEHWLKDGKQVLKRREEAGEAYFRLESSESEQILERLSSRVELGQVREVLRMYFRALTGMNAQVLSTKSLKDKGIGWTAVEKPSTEGTGVYLPPLIERYDTKVENFGWYKVMVTHQAGHLEFGSFDFSFEREARLFPNVRFEFSGQERNSITDMERFFDLFPDRRLAADIFTAVEDSRVDYRLKREYAGIRDSYERAQREALGQRPSLHTLPMKVAFTEVLVQMSLQEQEEVVFPAPMASQLRAATRIGSKVKSPQATVEDSAEATIRLYALLSAVANELCPQGWQTIDLGQPTEALDELKLSLAGAGGGQAPGGDELPYESPQGVEFRGDFKPELVQLLMKLRKDYVQKDAPLSPLTPEALMELAEKSAEIELASLSAGDLSSSFGLFISNIIDEAIKPLPSTPDAQRKDRKKTSPEESPLNREELTFLYDEWDFRVGDYKPRWCRVHETALAEGSTEFFENTMKSHAHLASEIKRQFEMLAPELLKKVKRLHYGDDFDLDAVIESMVENKAGISPSEKVYWRRNKVERDAAVVFLLDMSASTSEAVEEAPEAPDPWDTYRDLRGPIPWPTQEELAGKKLRQIIDVEKESLVLLIGALETIGDRYGIYGFSGYGRDNVEFFVIKDIEQALSQAVEKRIDKVAPMHATRMGPAIRHATSKLEAQEAKTKMLIVISDGRPQDQDYGRDSMEKDYAIHDTQMALLEAKRKGITPFCLTVDKGGQDYLRKMCPDIGYEVVWDIESLPKHLPALYRRLTA